MSENTPQQTRKRRAPRSAWKPGCPSPNPGGRPRGAREVRALLQDNSPEAVETLLRLMREGPPAVAARAAEAVLDRAWGTLARPVTFSLADVTDAELEAECVRLEAKAREEAAQPGGAPVQVPATAQPAAEPAPAKLPPRVVAQPDGDDD